MLPYRSQRGYSRGAVEYMRIFNITTWDNIKLGYQAFGLLRVDFRTQPIDTVRNAWGEVGDAALPCKMVLNGARAILFTREQWASGASTAIAANRP